MHTFVARTNLNCMYVYRASFWSFQRVDVVFFREFFVLLRVDHFTDLEVLWLITTPFTVREQLLFFKIDEQLIYR